MSCHPGLWRMAGGAGLEDTDETNEDPQKKGEKGTGKRRATKKQVKRKTTTNTEQKGPKMRRLSAKQIGGASIIQNRPSQAICF